MPDEPAATAHNARSQYNYGINKLRHSKTLNDRMSYAGHHFLSCIVASGCKPIDLIIRSGLTAEF